MREGKFDNLAGTGKPLNLEPMPADENARMTWWMLRILKSNNFTPEEVVLRRKIETLKHELSTASTEHRVAVLAKTVNELVRELNTLGTNAINIAVSPVSPDEERRKLHERLAKHAQEASPSQPGAAAPSPRRKHPAPIASVVECATLKCKTPNPATARFCRRCGKVLPTP